MFALFADIGKLVAEIKCKYLKLAPRVETSVPRSDLVMKPVDNASR